MFFFNSFLELPKHSLQNRFMDCFENTLGIPFKKSSTESFRKFWKFFRDSFGKSSRDFPNIHSKIPSKFPSETLPGRIQSFPRITLDIDLDIFLGNSFRKVQRDSLWNSFSDASINLSNDSFWNYSRNSFTKSCIFFIEIVLQIWFHEFSIHLKFHFEVSSENKALIPHEVPPQNVSDFFLEITSENLPWISSRKIHSQNLPGISLMIYPEIAIEIPTTM